ncbi:MAG: MAPEG family protein [Gammaproteobacteria bacterium]|nr:MAPEG family protein [Gammaproteobacteria bacterium]
MEQQQIFAPVTALVFLTLLVWLFMYHKRLGFMRRQKLDPEALKSKTEGEKILAPVAGPSDNLKNLFEMPVLFYLLCIVLFVLSRVDATFLNLAWAYVGLRALHSLIQSTYNRIVHRFSVYMLSMIVLVWMWLRFALAT